MKRLGSSAEGQAGTAPAASARGRSDAAGGAGRDGDEVLAEERVAEASTTDRRWAIGELAQELGVSTRTIRFYETSGLISPERRNGARVYGRRDRARMHIILRGKNLGFSLDDIREYLRLYDDDPNQVSQTQMLMQKVDAAIHALEKKKVDLERTLGELRALRERAADFLARKARS